MFRGGAALVHNLHFTAYHPFYGQTMTRFGHSRT
nr:MAG TPA: hypothetical protein [Caudoviricetes sp.]